MRRMMLFIAVAMIGMGCATNQDLQVKLDNCRQSLTDQDMLIAKQESTIRQKDQKIAEKQEAIKKLEDQLAELNRRLNISSTEQSRYNDRIRRIAASVRDYIKKQIREDRNFLTDIALEDFVGNPLIKRANTDDKKNMIVDVAHPVAGKGQINGIGGYFTGPCEVHIKLLRPVGGDYIVTYNKPLKVEAAAPGKKLIDFDQPIIVQKGDIVAYFFPGPVNVPYDSELGISTYFKIRADSYQSGDRVEADDIWRPGQTKRKYSLNYYGIFYTKVSETEQKD